MINLLLCGNKKVFDGALTELISITNRTKESINCYIFTMDASRIKPEYVPIENKQIDFLNKVIQKKNKENKVTKVDVTNLYEQEFLNCKNESAYCTPYTLLRLLADMVPNIPDKLLYLDIDMMIGDDLSKLYNIDVSEYEYAAVKEKYGSIFIRPDYINAGMLLMNMKKIKETKLLEKARNLIKSKKMLFADQDAIFRSTSKKMLIPRKYNEQSKFNRKDTVVCHFCKRMLWFPYPHTENYKQWNVEQVHTVLKCHAFDEDLEEYLKLKKELTLLSKDPNVKRYLELEEIISGKKNIGYLNDKSNRILINLAFSDYIRNRNRNINECSHDIWIYEGSYYEVDDYERSYPIRVSSERAKEFEYNIYVCLECAERVKLFSDEYKEFEKNHFVLKSYNYDINVDKLRETYFKYLSSMKVESANKKIVKTK